MPKLFGMKKATPKNILKINFMNKQNKRVVLDTNAIKNALPIRSEFQIDVISTIFSKKKRSRRTCTPTAIFNST
jgi:hypothetical protein